MVLSFNREEAVIVSRSMNIYIRSLEKRLSEARSSGDEETEATIKKKIRRCTKIILKAKKFIENNSNFFYVVSEDFSV